MAKKSLAVLLSLLLILSACGNPAAQQGQASAAAASAGAAVSAAAASNYDNAENAENASAPEGPSDEAVAAMVPESGYITCGDFRISDAGDGTVSVVGYTGYDTEVVIPAELEGEPVTAIGQAAFFNQTHITGITLPDTITSIGDGAFVNCSGLKQFVMPDSVTTLGSFVFARASALETVTLSSALTELPLQTFYGCTALHDLTLPESVKVLGDDAFAFCTSLTDFRCTTLLDSIGQGCFFSIQFTTLTLRVKNLLGDALSGATVSTLILEDGLETMESEALGNGNYDEVSLPATLQNIASDALSGARVRKLTIDAENPYFCTEYGGLYTKDETTLLRYQQFLPEGETTITFPDALEKIGDYAFSGFAGSLDSGEPVDCALPDSVAEIGAFAFQNAVFGTISLPEGITSIPENAFAMADAAAVTIPDSVTEIGAGAFQNARENLSVISIPASVTEIGDRAFSGCQGLTAIEVAADNPSYASVSGMLYDKDGKTLIAYPGMNQSCADGSVLIPEGTETIGAGAFETCLMFSSVTIPDSVITIGEKAFYCCDGLTAVSMGAGVTDIGDEAFGYTYPKASREDAETSGLRIIGEEDSAAYQYALDNDIAFYTEEPVRETETLRLNAGETATLDQTGILPELVQYTSSDEHIAGVSADGTVEARSAGSTTIVLSCGYDYITYPVEVSGESAGGEQPTTAEQNGADYDFDPDDYTELTIADTGDFQARYTETNGALLDLADNNCIHCYSGDEYKPILAAQGDERRIIMMESSTEWTDYQGLFGLISDGLYEELARYQNTENIVLYRGIPAAAEITGTGNSVADMKASIGTVFKAKTNLSTSVIHHVATGFAMNSDNPGQAVLEIYAPADMLNGSYIASLAQLGAEYELLINQGAQFLILDAGVRTASVEAEDGTVSDTTERYFKLLLIADSVEKVSVNLPLSGDGTALPAEAEVMGTGLSADTAAVTWSADGKTAAIRLEPAQYYQFDERETKIYVNGALCAFTIGEDGTAEVSWTAE